MSEVKINNCTYVDCTPEQIELLEEARAWNIAPLKYGTPRGFEININRQELGFYDTSILSDPNLSLLELRLMIDICGYYPTDIDSLLYNDIGYHEENTRPQGLQDTIAMMDVFKSLSDRGYITLNAKD